MRLPRLSLALASLASAAVTRVGSGRFADGSIILMAERTSYPYGYKPIQSKNVSAALPEWERQKAQARRNNLRNQKSYKVLLIGESGVGKSTLVARLCEDRFLAESRQHTLGIDMFDKEIDIDGERIKMYIWDTVGTERFDSITTQYYRGGAGIILVYDMTSLDTFNQLAKWIGYVQNHATADVSLMLVASKSDLEGKREVTREDGMKFSQNHEIHHFYEVSAKTGDNVTEAFESFFREIHRKAVGPEQSKENIILKQPNGKKCCGTA